MGDLFIQKTNDMGDLVTTYAIDPETTEKLFLEFSSAPIRIVSDAESPRVELINFPINTFTYGLTAGTMTVGDNTSIMTMFNLGGSGEQFHGLRHYLNADNFKTKDKQVIVYLTSDLTLDTLNITSDRSPVTVTSVSRIRKLSITGAKCDVEVRGVSGLETIDVKITEKGNARIDKTSAKGISVEIASGDLTYVTEGAGKIAYHLTVKEQGMIYLDGNEAGGTFVSTVSEPDVNCQVNITEGNIFISALS